MPLTDTFVRAVKPAGAQAKNYTDGNGIYLLVNESGKYWRLSYRFLGKRKTLALGVHPLFPFPNPVQDAITEPHQVAGLMRSIYGYGGLAYVAAALKLTARAFVRPGKLRNAEWAGSDFDDAEWRLPGSKMKMKSDHIVPLSRQALKILQSLQPMTGHGRFVFPSVRTDDRCMSENTVATALRSMGYPKEVMSAHGFRAMARTILDKGPGERVDLIEHQLAHTVKDPNGRAYNRTASRLNSSENKRLSRAM